MALVPTELQKAIIKVSQSKAFQRYEGRLPGFGAIQALTDNTNQLVPKAQLEASRVTNKRVTEIPVMQGYDATLITERACEYSPDDVTTALVPLAWNTTGFVIKEFGVGVYANNHFSKSEHYEHQLKQGLKKALAEIENDFIAFLEANKSTVNASPIFPGVVADARVVLESERTKFYRSISAIMARNDLPQTEVIDITNSESVIDYDFIGAQGRQNSINTAYQIDSVIPYRTNAIAPTEDFEEIHYLIAPGGVGLLTWNSPDARASTRVGEHQYFTTISDPLFGFTWDLIVNKKCEDLSATYLGETATVTTTYALVIDYAFITPYLSDPNESVIFKYVIGADGYLIPEAESASLLITATATAADNVTVTLDGIAYLVALAPNDTATQAATKLRAASYTGWTTGGTGATVTFTANATGAKVDATYSAGATGATGIMTTTVQGA